MANSIFVSHFTTRRFIIFGPEALGPTSSSDMKKSKDVEHPFNIFGYLLEPNVEIWLFFIKVFKL
jgi:hypothetical protein